MKAVILAAGRGTRIDAVAHGLPKCLLAFVGNAILDYQIQGLLSAGVPEIGIVVGHNAGLVIEHVTVTYPECLDCFHFFHNPAYATTNNISSLFVARNWVAGSDFLCLNADVLCHPGILASAAASPGPVSMVVDPAWRDETMKVIARNRRILSMGKHISRKDYTGTYIGFTKFTQDVTTDLFSEIEAMVDEGLVNVFFNAAVQRLVDRGLRVNVSFTGGLPWAEIDDPADFEYARAHVYPKLPVLWRRRRVAEVA